MKQYLLGNKGNFYKANLHCHTNWSDGSWTAEQVKEYYKEHGYSVVAFTDHDALIPHQDLRDPDFLPLNGVEIAIRNKEADVKGKRPLVHMNFIALEEDNVQTPCYHRSKNIIHNEEACRAALSYDESLPDVERLYTVESINALIAEGKRRGFYVIYNHPVWSFENPSQLLQYEGLDAIEVYNHDCYISGFDEFTPYLYDFIHRNGMKLSAVAADDNHDRHPVGMGNDSCGGWIQIQADKLEYRTITKALEKGDYYASNGATIHKVWVEDSHVCVECDPAERIVVTVGNAKSRRSPYSLEPVTEGKFKLPSYTTWFRVTVWDKNGKFAMTRAYTRDELIEELLPPEKEK